MDISLSITQVNFAKGVPIPVKTPGGFSFLPVSCCKIRNYNFLEPPLEAAHNPGRGPLGSPKAFWKIAP
jgi:hypothetical protein